MSTYLAADFGGGSGRIMAGTLTEGKLKLEEVYRFCQSADKTWKLCLLGFSFSF